ncbi:MAG: response regulator [candidate division Zixibacteria bacterium]|nr:response regulator [candidate division Zixibacteria bacterium]
MKEEIKRILWVDDEIDQLKSHIIFLESRGYKVTEASNGEDAVALVGSRDFDLVLLDEVMPGKDGLTTLEEIKQENPHLPVIMVTKSEEEDLMDQAIGKKIDDYLTKPVNPSQILSAAKKILDAGKIRTGRLAQDYAQSSAKIRTALYGVLNWQDWIDIHRTLSEWDLEIDGFGDTDLRQTHHGQRRECNLEFSKYIEAIYLKWLAKENPPPLSVDVVRMYLFPPLSRKKRTVFIVMDCMRLDQWMTIEPILDQYFHIQRDYYYSILPTATPYSRNAIFSGLFPSELAHRYPELWKAGTRDDSSRNRYEHQLLDDQLRKLGLRFKSDSRYVKVLDAREGESLAKKISSYRNIPLLSVVFNFLDILAHGRSQSEILKEMTPDESAYRSLTRPWFLHSSLLKVLQYLSTQDCTVVLTSDHGSVWGTRGTIARGKRETSTNLRYKYGDNLNCDPKDALLVKEPLEYRLPRYGIATTYIIAKEDFYFIYPTRHSEYEREYKNSFQHGGISLEEMILPVVTMTPRR